MTDEEVEYGHALKMMVIDQALQAGPQGSSGYAAAITAGIAQLRTEQANLRQVMVSNGGRQVTSVNAGEAVSWSTPLSLQSQIIAYGLAIFELQGMSYRVTRTTARFLY